MVSNPDYEADFYRRRDRNTRPSAEVIVEVTQELGPFSSVVDVGCGVGTFLDVFREHGAHEILGIEGDWVDPSLLQIPAADFRHHDLSRPLRLDRRFDLALSLEVAEHLPPESARGFVSSLTRLAPVVLFSAAVPFQGGHGHVNEQWPEYWVVLFAENGYAVADPIRPRVWNDRRVRPWYAQNCLMFVCRDRLGDHPHLAMAVEQTDVGRLAMAHPRIYERNSDPSNLSLRQILVVLPRRLADAVRRRLIGGGR